MAKKTQTQLTSRTELAGICAQARSAGRKIGFTSGVFDLLHGGHVEYLGRARELCDLLIVAVNSDASVRALKGPQRPVRPESERALVVSALAAVDYVFIFEEQNNNKNIEELKPDIYIKAGDYDKQQLSSAPLVEAYGGRVELIKPRAGQSTTSIIAEIQSRIEGPASVALPDALREKKPAVFLDRDGTINENVEYLHEPEKFRLIPNAIEAMKLFEKNGYRVVIVTNQPGIGLGYFTKEQLFVLHKVLVKEALKSKLRIERFYYCPHNPMEQCRCRKPETGMIEQAVRDLNIDLAKSYVIGDMTSDVLLAKNAGCKSVLLKTGYGGKDGKYQIKADIDADDLMAAAKEICK